MIKKLILIASLWLAVGWCSAQTAVTGTVLYPNGSGYAGNQVVFALVNCGNNTPTVIPTAVIAPNTTTFTTAADGTFSGTLYGNDQITCGGAMTSRYSVTYLVSGVPTGPVKYYFVSLSVPFNLNTAVPVQALPPITAPYPNLTKCPAGSVVTGFNKDFSVICTALPSGASNSVITNPTGNQTIAQPIGTGFAVNSLNGAKIVDGVIYTSIQSAIVDAGILGAVVIPSNYAGTDVYINTFGIPITDNRYGHVGAPIAGLNFNNNNLFMWRQDNTPGGYGGSGGNVCCNGKGPAGVGGAAPMVGLHLDVFPPTDGSNNSNVMPLYTDSEWKAGSHGYATGMSMNVIADRGSNPNQIFNNVLIADNSGWTITSCVVGGGNAVVTLNTTGAPLVAPVGGGVLISGNTLCNTGRGIAIITSSTSNTVTFARAGSSTGTGGVLAPTHLAWTLEVDGFNNNHDTGPTSPVSFLGGNLPFHGITSTGNGVFSLSEAFLADGYYYEGFLSQNAGDADFVAGYPTVGGGRLQSAAGFAARPMCVGTSGANCESKSIIFTDSTYDATSIYKEGVFQINYQPLSGADAAGDLVFTTGLASGSFSDGLQLQFPSGSASVPTYAYNGVGNTGDYLNGSGCKNTTINGVDRFQVCSSGITTTGSVQGASVTVGPGTPVTWTVGTVNPSGACPSGSLYSNTSGGLGDNIWGCDFGSWVRMHPIGFSGTKTFGAETVTIVNGIITAVTP